MTTQIDWPDLLAQLSEPFPGDVIQWRAGATSRDRKRAQALPFVDPRLYEDRMNRVCPGDWQVIFKPWGESRLICELTIHEVTRASTGEFDDGDRVAQGTAAEAQAFKRACSKFGLGRYLCEIPIQGVDYDEEKRRLQEQPALPARFLPAAPPSAVPMLAEAAVDADASLNAERAEAMKRELEKLGVDKDEHRSFVATVLGRRVRALADLSEAEALEVWNAAKRTRENLAS